MNRVAATRKKAALKPTERVVFMVVRRLMDPDTGESIKALVPAAALDRAVMQERNYRVGDQLTADLFKQRNVRFYRLAHGLAKFVRDNREDFEGLSIHAALKKLQRDANIECDEQSQELDLGTLGKHSLMTRQPRSLNFYEMDDGVFAEVWGKLCDYVAVTFFPSWTSEQVQQAIDFWKEGQT